MARIQNNMMANNTHRQYSINNASAAKSAEKLSSGYKINRAGDDAAGLAISEKMRAQIRGLNMASKNSQDAVSLIQTAEGALQEVHSMLQRMGELATQSATGTNEDFDRSAISAEFDQLKSEIDDISDQTTFNNMKLLDGSLASASSKVNVDTNSGMAVGKTLNSKYTITGQTGLSSQVGKYTIAAVAGNTNAIQVTFTDTKTSNATNTVIDLRSATSGDFKAGGAFKVDLSAAGMGTFEMTADAGATPAAADLATELIGASVLTYGALTTSLPVSTSDVAVAAGAALTKYDGVTEGATAGKYTLTATGTMLTITDEKGNTATATLAAATDIDLSNLTFSDGSKANLGKFTAHTTAATSTTAAMAALLNGKSITVPESKNGEGTLKIQVGANEKEQLAISVEAMNSKGLGLTASTIANQEDAGKAITATKAAINTVSTQRSALGAMQNRLEHKIKNLNNSAENLQSAESTIRDVDMASEMTEFTKQNILTQAATAMLAQANSAPQNVLQLLG